MEVNLCKAYKIHKSQVKECLEILYLLEMGNMVVVLHNKTKIKTYYTLMMGQSKSHSRKTCLHNREIQEQSNEPQIKHQQLLNSI
jgi:hypothetical protein